MLPVPGFCSRNLQLLYNKSIGDSQLPLFVSGVFVYFLTHLKHHVILFCTVIMPVIVFGGTIFKKCSSTSGGGWINGTTAVLELFVRTILLMINVSSSLSSSQLDIF